jgi:hypothetical protein
VYVTSLYVHDSDKQPQPLGPERAVGPGAAAPSGEFPGPGHHGAEATLSLALSAWQAPPAGVNSGSEPAAESEARGGVSPIDALSRTLGPWRWRRGGGGPRPQRRAAAAGGFALASGFKLAVPVLGGHVTTRPV